MPWRSPPGQHPEPYHVWLSEVMLQQTQVATVIPYYRKFLAAYPTLFDLAKAPVEDVLGLWAGLGYYARGRNLHACARAVAERGAFPRTEAGLLALPGIGRYTAAAIGAIAFGLPLLPVDGNVERVTARLFAIQRPLPAARPEIATTAAALLNDEAARRAPGDFAQALFDLGATICLPRRPACAICPWQDDCRAYALGIASRLPARSGKPVRPAREGDVYVLLDESGQVFLVRRPDKGLLGGMPVLPETPPVAAGWRPAGRIRHAFTHFSLTLNVYAGRIAVLPEGLHLPATTAQLPSVMRKALNAALAALDGNIIGGECSSHA